MAEVTPLSFIYSERTTNQLKAGFPSFEDKVEQKLYKSGGYPSYKSNEQYRDRQKTSLSAGLGKLDSKERQNPTTFPARKSTKGPQSSTLARNVEETSSSSSSPINAENPNAKAPHHLDLESIPQSHNAHTRAKKITRSIRRQKLPTALPPPTSINSASSSPQPSILEFDKENFNPIHRNDAHGLRHADSESDSEVEADDELETESDLETQADDGEGEPYLMDIEEDNDTHHGWTVTFRKRRHADGEMVEGDPEIADSIVESSGPSEKRARTDAHA